MEAFDSYHKGEYFEGYEIEPPAPAGRLVSRFDKARNSAPSLNYNDPEAVLNAFEKAFAATGATIEPYIFKKDDKPEFIYGGFVPFTIYLGVGHGNSFLNTITYNPHRSEALNAVSNRHEKFHAIQWTTPELHASPYNMLCDNEVPILLSPRSWVLATLLTERDAYAKTAWLSKLEAERDGVPMEMASAKNEIVNPECVAKWQKRFPDDLGTALCFASSSWDNKIRERKGKNNTNVTLRDHYIDLAIIQYNCDRTKKSDQFAKPVFIDLDDAAILALGASFGPSIFGESTPHARFKTLTLTSEQESEIRKLERRLDIQPGQKFPNLKEALGGMNMTIESFMERSRQYMGYGPAYQHAKEQILDHAF